MAEETCFLDRGDGTCRHYDAASKGCSIYNFRPDICRVDLQFERHYSRLYSWEEFVELNLAVCRQLIAEEGQM
ncbi:YkgJ family cysteine cluster protein [Gibbsiella quercinecans]|uniref:YkgJ family cysteine cluster protein n=1 Tax=Gibbsiella quercinecans TaxID=929813 RepID=UPI001E390666|nr:YkgJ family cysteine cluster protein [Gibbsiella quercinecans]